MICYFIFFVNLICVAFGHEFIKSYFAFTLAFFMEYTVETWLTRKKEEDII